MTKEEVIEVLERFVLGAKPYSQREIVDACASAYGMLKKQPSLPSNLDEAAEEYAPDLPSYIGNGISIAPESRQDLRDAFKAGAEWMAGQFEKNRLAACEAQTEEEYERETSFADKIIREQHRTPTFSDAINFGIEWDRAKMMEKAIDGRVIKSYNPVTAIDQPTLHGIELIYPDKDKPYLVAGDEVKVIVIPEEDEK